MTNRPAEIDWLEEAFDGSLRITARRMFGGWGVYGDGLFFALIAADMLAQNPGLGKFVWDTFQNGSTESMAQIIVAVFAIGFIGFVLDRIMLALQRLVTFGGQTL